LAPLDDSTIDKASNGANEKLVTLWMPRFIDWSD
jgi:hypothetical protein